MRSQDNSLPEASERIAGAQRLLRDINRFQTEGEFKDFDLLMQKVGHFVLRLHTAKQELLAIMVSAEDSSLKREAIAILGKTIQAISDLERGLCLIGKSGRLDGILANTQPISNLTEQVAGNRKNKQKSLTLCLPQSITL